MFITLAPWRIISLTSLPGPSCSAGKTVIWTLPLVRAATFFAKNSAAWCAGSDGDSECAKRILISCADTAVDTTRAATARLALNNFMVMSPGVIGGRRFAAAASRRRLGLARCAVRVQLAARLRAGIEDAQLP